MRHLVIVNPRAGRGRGDLSGDRLRRAFEEAGIEARIEETRAPGHATELVAADAGRSPGVVVVGGDGTLHEAIQGLDLEHQRLGILPRGTGNDFAYAHHWPASGPACIARIARGEERRVDLGVWDGDGRTGRFHNSVGLGFEALVNEASHRITRLRGPLVYVAALVRTLPRFRAYPVQIRWETGAFTGEVSLLAAANGPRVGGCFHLAPDADPADGLLDLVYTGALTRLRALTLVPGLLPGSRRRSARILTARAPEFTIEAGEPIPVYVDGEFLGASFRSLRIRVTPGGLRTF